MAGLTPVNPADLPSNLPHWLSAFGLKVQFGTQIGQGATVKYAIHTTGINPMGQAYNTLTAAEVANIKRSVDKVAQDTGLKFVLTNDANADLFIGATSANGGGAYGRTWQNQTTPVEVVAYDSVYTTADGLANNPYIFVHELLHGVGLEHSTSTFASTQPVVIPASEDYGTTLFGNWVPGWDGGTQLFDVAALQFLYGPDTSLRAGNNTYVPIFGAYDATKPNQQQPLLWDGAGFDTINLSSAKGGATASLAPGFISQVNTTNTGILEAGTFSINYNSHFEKLVGTNFNDTLYGDTGNEVLVGLKGKDVIFGRAGRDVLDGRNGNDMLNGGLGNDKLYGGNHNDRLFGSVGFDRLFGGNGRDLLVGGKGNDFLTGGRHMDTFLFKATELSGKDTIRDFQDGLDHIKFTGGMSFADLTITDTGTQTIVSWATGEVALDGIAAVNVTIDDFIFA